MNILLTGSNGYIGNSIFNILKDKYHFTLLNRDICDITDTNSVDLFFKDKFFDCVIHSAVSGGSRFKKDNKDVIENNIVMFYNLYKNKNHFKKFISFGSGAEIYDFLSPYGFSKSIINNVINDNEYFYNLRIFGIFDYNELETRFIKNNILNSIKNKPLEIYKDKKMDFFYMEDFISLIDHYLKNDNLPKIFDCCYQQHLFLSEICLLINNITHKKNKIIIHSTELDRDYIGEYKNINLKYHGLEKGIQNTFNKLKEIYES